jgi:hypothetical protein
MKIEIFRGRMIWLLAHPLPPAPFPSVGSTGDTQKGGRGWARGRIKRS